MKKNNFKIALSVLALSPVVTFAAGKTLKDIADLIVEYLNIGLALIIGLAVVTFVWNVYLYFFTEKDKKDAAKYVMYSVIGFFVILSFWGIVAVVRNSLNLDDSKPASLNFGGANNSVPLQGTPGNNSGGALPGTPGNN
mgnify:FL=1